MEQHTDNLLAFPSENERKLRLQQKTMEAIVNELSQIVSNTHQQMNLGQLVSAQFTDGTVIHAGDYCSRQAFLQAISTTAAAIATARLEKI